MLFIFFTISKNIKIFIGNNVFQNGKKSLEKFKYYEETY